MYNIKYLKIAFTNVGVGKVMNLTCINLKDTHISVRNTECKHNFSLLTKELHRAASRSLAVTDFGTF